MEEYVNNETIVQDDIYKLFKSSIICPLCNNIFINPIMCMKCQNSYCQKCIDKDNKECPNKCKEPTFNKCLSKIDILSKLKFKCKKCGIGQFYHEIKNHSEACDSNNISSQNKQEPKLKKISIDDIDKLKKKGIEVDYITGKILF